MASVKVHVITSVDGYTARDSKFGFRFAGIPVFAFASPSPALGRAPSRHRQEPNAKPWRRLYGIPNFESLPVESQPKSFPSVSIPVTYNLEPF